MDASFPEANQSSEESSYLDNVDKWYLRLIQFVHLLGSAFVAPHFWKGEKTIDDTFDELKSSINELTTMPGHDGKIIIYTNERHRDLSNKIPTQYIVKYSNIILDTETAAKLDSYSDTSIPQLLKKLQIAFDIFSLNGIKDLLVRLPNGNKNTLEQIRVSLEILSHFDQALLSGNRVVYHQKNQEYNLPIVKNEYDPVDPNLTLVAAINYLSETALADIFFKVRNYIQEHLLPSNPESQYSVYNVMFCLKGLKEKLILPPIEVNNYKWRRDNEEKQYSANITADKLESSAVKGQLEKDIRGNFSLQVNSTDCNNCQGTLHQVSDTNEKSAKQKSNQILDLTETVDNIQTKHSKDNKKNINNKIEQTLKKGKNDDCNFLDVNSFISRLREATDILASLENTAKGDEILDGIIASLYECLEQVGDEFLDDVSIEDNHIFLKNGSTSEIVEKFYTRIQTMLSRFKDNATLNEEAIVPRREVIKFQKVNYLNVSKQFDLPVSEVKEIIKILKGCFDNKGYFIRTEFELRIPQFISYDDKIFEFLWRYLNEPLHRTDRIAFLNSLNLLASKLNQPVKIMSFLLDELFKIPQKLFYSDRNAFLLISLLLRNYNKETSVDIELTPGEVLLVKNGLNEDILAYTLSRIKADEHLIKEKLETIHDRLVKALHMESPKSFSWDPHFLLSLEREAFVFLSIVNGELAHEIIMSALIEYGNPRSKIYDHYHEEKFLLILLQHLKLIIRGMGRVGEIEDLGVLADFKKNENDFIAMFATAQNENNVRQVFKTIDIAMETITSLQ